MYLVCETEPMHPLLPADADIHALPRPECALDGKQASLTADEAERLAVLGPRLNGQLALPDVSDSGADQALITRLHGAGLVFDLPTSTDGIPVTPFCDYLYARISGWRKSKQATDWPWRRVIDDGEARIEYLKGILVENYHYVRAAVTRQSPLLSQAMPGAVFDLVRKFIVEEATHEHYFLESLTRWDVDPGEVEHSVPLTATAQFIALQYRLAHLSVLDYLAGSAVLEVDPAVYDEVGDPYQRWETVYCLGPRILAPVREHIRDDVAGDHAQLFRAVVRASGQSILPAETAIRLLRSARTVFEATRLWQRGMYEHYYIEGADPTKAGL